jgi:uncharacterized protein (TIGR02284 family)
VFSGGQYLLFLTAETIPYSACSALQIFKANHMENHKVDVEILNDLIEIHNDRVVGYEKAIDELKEEDNDLNILFNEMIQESHRLKAELTKEVILLGAKPEEGTTASGKIYRAWMDVKTVFTGSDRETILSNCEFGEDAAQTAYRTALETEGSSIEVRTLLIDHQSELRMSHDRIRSLRDQLA